MVVDAETNDNDNTCVMSVPHLCNGRATLVQDNLTAKTAHRLYLYVALGYMIATCNDLKQWTITERRISIDCDWRCSFDCGDCDVGDVMLHNFFDILRKYKFYIIL